MSRSQSQKSRARDRIELLWDGKPQTPNVKTSRTPLRVMESFGVQTSGRRNMLIRGDNKLVMAELLDEYRGQVDLIYIDPPFDGGADRVARVSIGEDKTQRVGAVAYQDRWGSGSESYLQMMYERLALIRELLSAQGSIYVHCDYRSSGFLRIMLDEIFGPKNFVNEIIWFYKTGGLPEKLGFGKKHDTIHFYAKSRRHTIWHPQKEKSYLMHKYGFSNIEILEDKRGRYTEVNCRDVFDIPALRGNQPERVDYPTQKPEALLERIIRASSNEGSLVADFFCGSGTTGVVAERLGRRWIMTDRERMAVHTTRKRLIGLQRQLQLTKPFDILETQTAPDAETAHLGIEPVYRTIGGVTVVDIRLNRFVPSASDLSDREKRTMTELESVDGIDLVDYWAVNFEPGEGPFTHDWLDFRSRNDRTLKTTSDIGYTYKHPGVYTTTVKAIDIFGRDLTIQLEIRI